MLITWSIALLHLPIDGLLDKLCPLLQLCLTVSCQWVEHFLIICQDIESMGLVTRVLEEEEEEEEES